MSALYPTYQENFLGCYFGLAFKVKLVSLTSIPGKVMEQILLKTISKDIKNKKVIESRQYGFTKGKSCLTNLIASCDEITSLVNEGRAMDIVYLEFSSDFNIGHCLL